VVARGLVQRSYSTPGPVSTGMGDRLPTGKPPRFVTSHSGQRSLLPSAGRKMSTGQSAVTLCGMGSKGRCGSFHVDKSVRWQVKLCDPSLTRAIPERFRDEFLTIKRYANLRLLCLRYLKPNSITLAGSKLVADRFEAGRRPASNQLRSS